jgi:predicted outer membrane repeat protein
MQESDRSSRRPRRGQASRKKKARVVSGAAATLGALAAGMPADAATFTVTNLNDAGAGSLRQAIADANGAAGADTVAFQAGLTGTITLTTGQLDILDSVDVQGPGAAALTVSGNNASRVFYLYNSAATSDVTISGLTVTGGNATIGGGIVDFDDNLTLDGVTVTGNTASSDGGGLWADGFSMTLTIRDSTFSGNTSGDDGGAIYIEDTGGPLLIQRTAITGNAAAGSGGGIYFYDPDDDVTVEDSTLSGNSGGGAGGGIYLYSPDAGLFTIRGTTVSGNDAQAGGGLFLYAPDHGGSIENSTISGNQATTADGGGIYLYYLYNFALHHVTVSGNSAAGTGGGVFVPDSNVPIDNSIVANNTAATDNDLGNGTEGSFDLSFSLVESPGTATITDNGGNVFNQDPLLGPLQNNGGLTQTHLPDGASPAVNAGSSAFTVDQRGQARPVGAAVDMGSVEVNPGTIQLTASAYNVNENGGTVTITATRTGGVDGAVSVSYSTAPGTAISPADFAAAAGALNWANQDGASKSFQVTIVNDVVDEPDETFTTSLSTPTGGAALGAITTATVTIVDDDVQGGGGGVNVVEIPTLGDVGKVALGGLVGLAGFLLLRRRKGLAASVVILSLALGETAAVSAAQARHREVKASTLTQIQVSGDRATIRLQDGTTVVVGLSDLEVKDRRQKAHGARQVDSSVEALATGQNVVVKVHRGADGTVGRVRVQIFDQLGQAQASAAGERK